MHALIFALAAHAAWTPDPTAPRETVPAEYRWKLGDLYPDAAAWEADRKRVLGRLDELDGCRGSLGEPRELERCLGLVTELRVAVNRLALYANLAEAVAMTDPEAARRATLGRDLVGELSRRTDFLRVEIPRIPERRLERAYRRQPGLAPYRVMIGEIRRRGDHVLGEEAERVLGLLGDNLWATVDLNEIVAPPEAAFQGMIADLDLPTIHDEQGAEVQLTLSNYGRWRASSDRAVRREAVQGLFGTLRKNQHVFAATLAGQAQTDVALARARGYDTAIEAYLDREDVDVAVVENLVDTVEGHLDALHRYVALRKKVLGLDEVHFYDMYVPLVPDLDRRIPYDEARLVVEAALAPLGEEYGQVLAEGMDPKNGWVDVYPHADKLSGAFCASAWGAHPYVLLNHQDRLYDTSTLAHEFGHAMHAWLSMQDQPPATASASTFLAETASTVNEALLLDYLLADAKTDEERMFLLNERLEQIKGTIYRQTMLTAFEWQVHRFVEEGTPITAELLDETWRGLVSRYYGPDYVLDEDDGMEWAYIPHLYYKYYVYTYATGLSSGLALARRVREGGPEARDAYLAMLRAGSSRPPLDLLRSAGVDMATPEPIETALGVFEDTLAELEVLVEMRQERARGGEPEAPTP